MPMSQAERLREALADGNRQRAHDAWADSCQALGHPPVDDAGEPIPDPMDQ